MNPADCSRRSAFQALSAWAVAALVPVRKLSSPRPDSPTVEPPRFRVIIDNDFSGDADDLFQTAHHLLSPSTLIRLIIGSHLHAGEHWQPGPAGHQASLAARKARELLRKMGRAVPVVAGAEHPLSSLPAAPTAASDAIIAEALRPGDPLPLFYCAGAGLTDLATAWLRRPDIGPRLKLVWIGGPEYPGISAPPPGSGPSEYNLTIDIKAAQVIFEKSDIEIWQVPRSTYRQMLVSYAELWERVRSTGRLGQYLVRQIDRIRARALQIKGAGNLGETYILGDSPLVTLTSLQSPFQPDPSSSQYVLWPCPGIDDQGEYVETSAGRPIRVYTRIDTRLTFEDFYAKLRNSRL